MKLSMFMVLKELIKSRIELVLDVLKFLPQQFLLSPWDSAQGIYLMAFKSVL
jgi:hypothetical protein